jgi:ATP-binding cassette subfamily B multidrug efflux pump
VSAAIGRDLRRETFSSVIHFSNAEIENFSTASLITRTTNDIQQVQFVCVMLLRMVAYAPILGIGGVLHVVGSRSGLSWIVVLDVAALLLLILFLMNVAMPKFKIMQTLVDRLNLVSREILTGIMPVRAFSREPFEEQRFDKANKDLMGTQLFTNRAMVAMMPFMTLIMNGTSLLIVWFGGKAMDNGTMQVGEMIAFITYTMQIVMSFLMLAMVAVMLPRAGVAADRIDEVIRTKATIHDPDEADAKAAKEHKNWQGVVEFHDVSFRFPGADSDALEHISFTAKPGETTAIIGSTGCGKSTLLNLIPRYDVTGGSVTVDGIDVRQMPQAQLHDLLGYVPQKGVLFSGTIDSNLKFGGDHITDAAVKKAAAIAQATEFIDAKPEGCQSPIAQGGSNVSGGQKQRLSIARAIAKDPKIYLFDDSFSALDYKTDVALRRALKAQTDNATVIIVAQRISTVLHANQILVLDEGRLVGKGTHAQLMASCLEYQEIARSQLSQKELDLGILNTEKEGV